MSEQVRVRFAPSPTGYLHVGGARTALFNWLLARHLGGTFVLRIEDTDLARSTEESVQAILDGMSWLGLDWDEGPGSAGGPEKGPHGPYFQTQRLDTYRHYADQLIAMGRAYKCYLTAEELEAKRAEAAAAGLPPGYNRAWAEKDPEVLARYEAEGRPFVLRFVAPASGTIVVHDLVHGDVSFDVTQMVDDFVLVKKDGVPTYNYAVVIDDATMGITHVLRGDDHLSNTPKQIAVYEALGLPVPRFGHIPMILGPDKSRLSKRHGATSVMQYSEDGFLPEALVNYLVRLGWSHGDQEIFTRQEMIDTFSVEAINKNAAVFDPQKLEWLNAHYLKERTPAALLPLVRPRWEAMGLPLESRDAAWMERVIAVLQERSRTVNALAESARSLFPIEIEYDPAATKKFLTPENGAMLAELRASLAALPAWDEASMQPLFVALAEARGLKLGGVIQPTRVAVTGSTVSPGMYEVLAILGRELSLQRLDAAIELAALQPQA